MPLCRKRIGGCPLACVDNLARQLSEPAPPLGKLIAVPALPAHDRAQADRRPALRDVLQAELDSASANRRDS